MFGLKQTVKNFLGGLTMYRMMLYFLRVLVFVAMALSAFKYLPYNWLMIFLAAGYSVIVCYVLNRLFATSVAVQPNYESPIITALIISLITGPFDFRTNLFPQLLFLTLAGMLAMASKYIVALNKRHIFNPAAFGVLGTFLLIGKGASWWVGNQYMLPFVVFGGLILLRRIRRFHLVLAFLLTYFGMLFLNGLLQHFVLSEIVTLLKNTAFFSPIVFFSFVMLVEPLTSPQDKGSRIYYGVVVALFLFVFQKVLAVPYTLELSLLTGNIFARIINPDSRLVMKLIRKETISDNITAFWFEPLKRFSFTPGQFLEWSFPHRGSDTRGTRRYFTISASPTEKKVLITTKFSDKGSSFKNALRGLKPGEELTALSLGGDFVLPKDETRKLVFIAGGIGITPFRSMIKYLIDNNLYRDAILLYSNRTLDDIVFKDLFTEALKNGIRTVYTLTEREKAPPGWAGHIGYIDADFIKHEIPDYLERLFYVSGPEPMVEAFEKMLYGMGIEKKNVKRDYFPGYTETHQA